jgi:putative RNA 2'-phosphotransferase
VSSIFLLYICIEVKIKIMSKKVSRLLSNVLRHKPENIGIKLDKQGWVLVVELLAGLKSVKDIDLSLKELATIVSTNDKKRFQFNEALSMIRASQGHSVKVDLGLKNERPPMHLFHGTPDRFLDSILREGLKKMKRHAVHLSEEVTTAEVVGKRRGKATVLEIQSARMYIDGIKFQKSENGVWLTDEVLPKYIRISKEHL